MIAFGCAITDAKIYERCAAPGIRAATAACAPSLTGPVCGARHGETRTGRNPYGVVRATSIREEHA